MMMTDVKVGMIVKHNGYLYRVADISKDHRSLELYLGDVYINKKDSGINLLESGGKY